MEEDIPQTPSNDEHEDVLRGHAFRKQTGINLHSFMVSNQPTTHEGQDVDVDHQPPIDEAVGGLAEVFVHPTKDNQAEPTHSQDEALVVVEQRLSRSLMMTMVLLWTMIGAMVGTILSPIVSAIGLLSMAGLGFFLTERWMKEERMHILAITWAIISMKLLYGLALDAWHWGWFDGLGVPSSYALGMSMLLLVGMNIWLAFRHQQDAIAAQSALVLFAVASFAGGVFGQVGIALFIVAATVLMHGLAIARDSGNLASLGISVSYLWVGLHAMNTHLKFGSFTLIPIADDFTLFLLLATVTAGNAYMATRFVNYENWLSRAVDFIGLGRPSLWIVSVALGMVGALITIAAHREQTGYALAQLILLFSAFSGSYLVVRGVKWTGFVPLLYGGFAILIALLIMVEIQDFSDNFLLGFTSYEVFAVVGVCLSGSQLLRYQSKISDHVIWIGAIVVVILLTILVPMTSERTSQLLLFSQAIVWLTCSYFAHVRRSPSIAGVVTLGPYVWLLMLFSDIDQRLFNHDMIAVVMRPTDIGIWLFILLLQHVILNIHSGSSTFNLASRFAGRTELSARLRDSGMMNLWTLTFTASNLTYIVLAYAHALHASFVLLGMTVTFLVHAVFHRLDYHAGNSQTMVLIWGVSAFILGWYHGGETVLAASLTISCGLLTSFTLSMDDQEGRQQQHHVLTLTHIFLLAFSFTTLLSPQRNTPVSIEFSEWTGSPFVWVLFVAMTVQTIQFALKAGRLPHLLAPTLTMVGNILAGCIIAMKVEGQIYLIWSGVLFVGLAVYLVIQGDMRQAIKAVTDKQERLRLFEQKRQQIDELTAEYEGGPTSLKYIDAHMVELSERARLKSKSTEHLTPERVLTADIYYKPSMVLMMVWLTTLGSAWVAYTTTAGNEALAFSGMFSLLLVLIARWRADTIGLRLNDMFGVEVPVLIGMVGLTLVHVAGRMTEGVLTSNATTHLALYTLGVLIFAAVGLLGRRDLAIRIPRTLEATLSVLVVHRCFLLFFGGEVPVPILFTPPTGPQLSSVVPLILVDAMLIGLAFTMYWIEKVRMDRELSDLSGALGRSAWMVGLIILGYGFAGFIAIGLTTRRAYQWRQPFALMSALVLCPLALTTPTSWFESFNHIEWLGTTSVIFAAVSVGWLIMSVKRDDGLFVAPALWGAQLLGLTTALFSQQLVMMIGAFLLMSMITWWTGILTLRATWRVVGAFHLGVSWLFLILYLGQSTTALSGALLFISLLTAIHLFVVTTLTQTHMKKLSES